MHLRCPVARGLKYRPCPVRRPKALRRRNLARWRRRFRPLPSRSCPLCLRRTRQRRAPRRRRAQASCRRRPVRSECHNPGWRQGPSRQALLSADLGTLAGFPTSRGWDPPGRARRFPRATETGTLTGFPYPPAMVRGGRKPAAPHASDVCALPDSSSPSAVSSRVPGRAPDPEVREGKRGYRGSGLDGRDALRCPPPLEILA